MKIGDFRIGLMRLPIPTGDRRSPVLVEASGLVLAVESVAVVSEANHNPLSIKCKDPLRGSMDTTLVTISTIGPATTSLTRLHAAAVKNFGEHKNARRAVAFVFVAYSAGRFRSDGTLCVSNSLETETA